MGIHKLMALLKEKTPDAIRHLELKAFSGRQITCDASMAMYQFLIATSGYENDTQVGFKLSELTDKDGNRTGHLVGLFNRTIMLLENGIKPIWVFDGKPPELKRNVLKKRKQIKTDAKNDAVDNLEIGNVEQAQKEIQKTTHITQSMIEDAKKMIRLMGLPIIEAPSEAEAQCAIMTLQGNDVHAAATEDMDTLTFGSKLLLRGFNSKKEPITEINLEMILEGLQLNMDEFVDLCILCGCDYCDSIDGIGAVTALKLINKYRTLEKVLEHLKSENQIKQKYNIPTDYPIDEARKLFKQPDVIRDYQIKFGKPAEQDLLQFLVEEKGFSENRVQNAIKKIKSQSGVQKNLEQFFGKPKIIKNTNKTDPKKTTDKKTKKK